MSDLKLTESTRAVFTCERGTVQFYFVDAGRYVGTRFLFTREAATDLGERIYKTGAWEEFPVAGISTAELRPAPAGLRHQWLLKAAAKRPYAASGRPDRGNKVDLGFDRHGGRHAGAR